jgi:hypothetical protein
MNSRSRMWTRPTNRSSPSTHTWYKTTATGLAAGLELRAAGLRVSVHERSERVLDDRGAGIVMQSDTQQLLSERCGGAATGGCRTRQ